MLNPHTAICCKIEMLYVKSGVNVIETYLDPPRPYRLYRGDLYRCQICGREIIAHLGQGCDVSYSKGKEFVERLMGREEYYVCYEMLKHAEDNEPIG